MVAVNIMLVVEAAILTIAVRIIATAKTMSIATDAADAADHEDGVQWRFEILRNWSHFENEHSLLVPSMLILFALFPDVHRRSIMYLEDRKQPLHQYTVQTRRGQR